MDRIGDTKEQLDYQTSKIDISYNYYNFIGMAQSEVCVNLFLVSLTLMKISKQRLQTLNLQKNMAVMT